MSEDRSVKPGSSGFLKRSFRKLWGGSSAGTANPSNSSPPSNYTDQVDNVVPGKSLSAGPSQADARLETETAADSRKWYDQRKECARLVTSVSGLLSLSRIPCSDVPEHGQLLQMYSRFTRTSPGKPEADELFDEIRSTVVAIKRRYTVTQLPPPENDDDSGVEP
ncbi:uncharacterized protein IL334_007894 [Kwoniella shivajii]|uniref:Uncharacterized protein n=1 Tax=Kwoniella shivajii TaxID=564305 RepID=A0ABZ1DC16_9TREE|nr:hypothetical protein IL334_007894 [Kwoniella shivajii]